METSDESVSLFVGSTLGGSSNVVTGTVSCTILFRPRYVYVFLPVDSRLCQDKHGSQGLWEPQSGQGSMERNIRRVSVRCPRTSGVWFTGERCWTIFHYCRCVLLPLFVGLPSTFGLHG